MHVPSFAIAHNYIETTFVVNKRISKWYNINMLELFEEPKFSLDGFPLSLRDISHSQSFDYLSRVVLCVFGQEDISVGSA